MLQESTRKLIYNKKWDKHSNPSQFFGRVQDSALVALEDLTLIAKNFDEEQLEKIFTDETLNPLLLALLKVNPRGKSGDRAFGIACVFLKHALNLTGRFFERKIEKKAYNDLEWQLREIIGIIYEERFDKEL